VQLSGYGIKRVVGREKKGPGSVVHEGGWLFAGVGGLMMSKVSGDVLCICDRCVGLQVLEVLS
jgi:hypothetical protein